MKDLALDVTRLWTGMQAWKALVQPYTPPPDGRFASILVPTEDVVRTSWLIHTAVSGSRACLLVGDSGAGKTAVMRRFLTELDPTADMARELNFSSQTSSLQLQTNLEVLIPCCHLSHYTCLFGYRMLGRWLSVILFLPCAVHGPILCSHLFFML